MGAPLKIEARFHRHPKVQSLIDRIGKDRAHKALGLWVLIGSHSADDETDGFVPDAWLKTKRERALADELVQAHLWERVKDGYQIHDFLDYNLSKKQLLEWRKSNRTRQTKWREEHLHNAVSHAASHDAVVVVSSSPVDISSPPSPEAIQARLEIQALTTALADSKALPGTVSRRVS